MTITTEGYDILPLRPQDVERIVRYIPDECVMVGGHVLIFWAEAFGIPFISHTEKTNVTKDMDFYGKEYLIDIIADNWNGRTRLISEIMDTSLIGQVIKKADDGYGYRVVDVLKKVFALKEEIFVKRAVKVPYHGHSLRVLHPIDLLKARVENVYGIKKKHTQHNADQMGLAIDVAREFLKLRVKQYNLKPVQARVDVLIADLREIARFAVHERLQGTAKAWNLDLLDAFPLLELDGIRSIEEVALFLDEEWPKIIEKAGSVKKIEGIGEVVEEG